jgi:hypothetical protein
MNFRAYSPKLTTLILLSYCLANFANAQAQTILSPTEHCQDFSADAIVTFADPDLAEVVNEALGLDADAALSCGQAASLEQS